MSTYKTEGIILRRSNFGEANLILHIYTKDFGKIEVVARSARKEQGKLKGHLEPFLYCDFVIVNGRKMDTVANSFILESFLYLRENMEKALPAFSVLEIADKMTIEDYRDERVFYLLKKSLIFLNDNSKKDYVSNLLLVLFFEINFLSLSGFRPHMEKCVFCGDKIIPGENRFSFSLGGALHSRCFDKCPDAISLSDESIKLIKFLEMKEVGAESYEKEIDKKLVHLSKIKVRNDLVFRDIFLLRDFIAFNLDKKINSFDVLYNFARRGN
jgi:DNA repair protein RecO (recombination protein O)